MTMGLALALVLLSGCFHSSNQVANQPPATVTIRGSDIKILEPRRPPQLTVTIKQLPVAPKIAAARSLYANSYDEWYIVPRKLIRINLAHGNGQRQHFTAFENNKAVISGLVSGAVTDEDSPPNYHPEEPHNHLGTFSVFLRDANYYSRRWKCPMPNALFFYNGHAIHSCLSQDIGKLGRPASHGCIRVSPANSRKLFRWAGSDPVTVQIVRE